MKRAALALALIACGDKAPTKLDSGLVSDAPALACSPQSGSKISMRLIATTHGAALLATSPPADPRLFVVEQIGTIRVLTNDTLLATPFLDLGDDIACCGEQGLLGLVFHPQYATNGTFFVFYTTGNANVVARYQVSSDPNVANKASGTIVLSIPDFASNHNGGMMEFGPDGYLYIGTGDGGGGGDPQANGQNPNALLGKMLRIDVDNKAPGKEYGIPATNPFATTGGAPEVYMMGLRNPWRWSFDSTTGDMWIGDVGQDEVEELDFIPAAEQAGANLGWRMYEADRCYDGPCNPASIRMPQFEKMHSDGWCSVIGGAVYRGSCYPDLVGTYFFTDYCAHVLGAAKLGAGNVVVEFPETTFVEPPAQPRAGFPSTPASLHADSRGELYLTTTECCGTQQLGGLYHLEATQ
ncbi:MAG TPA: PQQ-dependent sugar dehydrogenase [Kofleriaceae bacterium]|nr:PQQ-dependent sugar dehydrogenase [Kofleriaceae bacterium]